MKTHRRHTGGEDDGVFLGDADVNVTVGHRLFQMLHAGAGGHRGGDADDPAVALAKFHHRLAHHVLIHWRRAGLGRGRLAGERVVRPEAVEFFRLFERGLKTLALLRQNVDDNRMVARLGKFQRADEQRQIVPVNRAEIAHTHFLEQDRRAVTAPAVGFNQRCGRLQTDAGQRALETALGAWASLSASSPLGRRRTKFSNSRASWL